VSGKTACKSSDINKDLSRWRGVGYRDADIIPLSNTLNTAFNPETIHVPIDADYKEFGAGRRYTWPTTGSL